MFSSIFSDSYLLPQKTESWFVWIFAGATPPMRRAPLCQEASRTRRAVTAQTPSRGKGPSELRACSTSAPAPAKGELCWPRARRCVLPYIAMEFTGQLLTVPLVSMLNIFFKKSISLVLTREIDWNFQSTRRKTLSYY